LIRTVTPAPQRALFALAALAGVIVLVLGAAHAGEPEAGRLDGWVPLAEGRWFTVAMAFDRIGDPRPAAVLLALLAAGCLVGGSRRLAVLAVAGPAVAVGATMVLKPIVGRTIHGLDNLAYPSGHTALGTAVGFVLALLLFGGPGRSAAAPVLTAAVAAGTAMGWAQVALGSHYETDAVGGICVALAVLPAVAWLVDQRLSQLWTGRLAAVARSG
jgi:membrane-associated phospholipid phosphatase